MKRWLATLLLGASLYSHAQPRVDFIPEDRLSYTVHKANPWSGRPAPTVMVGHGCSGIVDIQTRDWAQDLNRWGYNVVVVDSWGPRGVRSVCKMQQPYYTPSDRMLEFYNIAERVKSAPWHTGKLGYIGFSHGGSLGLALAGEGIVFDAVVSYYPGCGPYAFRHRAMRIPTLMHVSNGDTWTPAYQCDTVNGPVQRVVHQDATHAWDIRAPDRVYMGEPLRYNSRADSISREATRKFLESNLQ